VSSTPTAGARRRHRAPSRRDFSTAPAPDATFNIYRDIYSYDRSAAHRSRRLATADWTVEKAVVDAVRQRAAAALPVPPKRAPSAAGRVFFPSACPEPDQQSVAQHHLHRLRRQEQTGGRIDQGRERRGEVTPSGGPTCCATPSSHGPADFSRAIDYLETRPDIDAIASASSGEHGVGLRVILTSLESGQSGRSRRRFFQIQQPAPGTTRSTSRHT
jgi:hypothetical protein